MNAYNNDGHSNKRFGQRRPRYEKGSFLQRMFDPLAGAPHDENGTTLFTVTDDNLRHFNLGNEAALRAEYEKLKSHDEVWETDMEDEVAFKLELLRQLQNNETEFKQEDFEEVLTRELSVFAKGEKYNYTKDLTDAYKNSLATTTEEKIFREIPDHVFWDIKKPQQHPIIHRQNRYNAFRGREYDNFFEMRASEAYIDRQKKKENLDDATSIFRRY